MSEDQHSEKKGIAILWVCPKKEKRKTSLDNPTEVNTLGSGCQKSLTATQKTVYFTNMLIEGSFSLHAVTISHDLALYPNVT